MKRIVRAKRQLSKDKDKYQQKKKKQQLSRRPPQFNDGSVVEVGSDEEGFSGSWFTATIIKSPSFPERNLNIGKVFVEYKTLVTVEDHSKPLREYVDAALVRPVPPFEEQPETFNIGDVVDAFYEEGWWTGTVSEFLEDSRFRVFFEKPPHYIEFCLSDLRIHRDWIKGSWVPLDDETAEGRMYSMGKRVEVSFDAGASPDVWFPATILEEKGNGAFLVECQKSDGNVGPLNMKETVDSHHIRPLPPYLKSKNFVLLEKVDAFYDFGWWTGVIIKTLIDSRYIVFIDHAKKDIEFAFSELRPHIEWKDGNWFHTSSQDVLTPAYHRNNENDIEKIGSNIGTVLPLTNSVSIKNFSQGKTSFSSISREKETELDVHGNDKPLAFDSSPKSYEKSSPVASLDYVSVENDILRQPQSHENHSLRKRGRTKRVRIGEMEENALVGSRNTGENRVHMKKLQNSAGGKEAEGVPGDCLAVDTDLPLVLGLACDNLRTPGSKRSYRFNGEETVKRRRVGANVDDTKSHAVKVTNQLEVVNGSDKKRRGRPRKSLLEAASITCTNDVNVSASVGASTLGQVLVGSSNDQINQENQPGIKSATSPPSSTGGEIAVVASRKQQREKHPTKRGKKQKTSLNLVSNVHDVTSPNSLERNTAEESYIMNGEVSIEELDNQPLSKWIGSLHSPTRADNSRSSLTRCKAKASNNHVEVVNEIRAVGIELENVPFEKKSMLWSTLESMEVFQKLPQKPHFKPLEHVKETVREGLAIGTIVTYTGVVEKTSKLQIEDTKETIDAILETLLELETNGFSVGVIRERVDGLLNMKEKQEEFDKEVEKLNSEISVHEFDKCGIEKEIEEIRRQIRELEEKMNGVMSLKVKKEGVIESLQLKLKDIEQGISSINGEFEQGISSPWP